MKNARSELFSGGERDGTNRGSPSRHILHEVDVFGRFAAQLLRRHTGGGERIGEGLPRVVVGGHHQFQGDARTAGRWLLGGPVGVGIVAGSVSEEFVGLVSRAVDGRKEDRGEALAVNASVAFGEVSFRLKPGNLVEALGDQQAVKGQRLLAGVRGMP